MPTAIAPEGFQTHQAFIAHIAPKLTGAFESALVLSARRFHGTAALWLSGTPCRRVVHSLPVASRVRSARRESFGRAS
jgi:hypothetical protein